jgi:hypothetical protein
MLIRANKQLKYQNDERDKLSLNNLLLSNYVNKNVHHM